METANLPEWGRSGRSMRDHRHSSGPGKKTKGRSHCWPRPSSTNFLQTYFVMDDDYGCTER